MYWKVKENIDLMVTHIILVTRNSMFMLSIKLLGKKVLHFKVNKDAGTCAYST